MKIQVLSVEVNNSTSKNGKPYEQLVVAYKDLDFGGKVASKTVMPFGFQKETFTTLKNAKPTDVYDVEVVKNEAGYNDWIKATKGTAATVMNVNPSVSSTQTSSGQTKGGWETPEERAKKQVYIIRQSSLSTAVTALTATGKAVPNVEEVIKYARQLEDFVFGTTQDLGTIETIPEDSLDVPF